MKYNLALFEAIDSSNGKRTPLFVTNFAFYQFVNSDPRNHTRGFAIKETERIRYGPESIGEWVHRGWDQTSVNPLQEALIIYRYRNAYRKTI